MPRAAEIHVEIAGAMAGLAGPAGLSFPAGARLADALEYLGASPDDTARVGIWGRRASPATLLREGDRIECYRPLEADPKATRRARASAKR